MLRRAPTRVEVSPADRDELDLLRKEKEKAKKDKGVVQFEHEQLDRNLPSKSARIGLAAAAAAPPQPATGGAAGGGGGGGLRTP